MGLAAPADKGKRLSRSRGFLTGSQQAQFFSIGQRSQHDRSWPGALMILRPSSCGSQEHPVQDPHSQSLRRSDFLSCALFRQPARCPRLEPRGANFKELFTLGNRDLGPVRHERARSNGFFGSTRRMAFQSIGSRSWCVQATTSKRKGTRLLSTSLGELWATLVWPSLEVLVGPALRRSSVGLYPKAGKPVQGRREWTRIKNQCASVKEGYNILSPSSRNLTPRSMNSRDLKRADAQAGSSGSPPLQRCFRH